MLPDDLLDALLLKVPSQVLLKVGVNLNTTAEGRVSSVGGDGEGAASHCLLNVLPAVAVLEDNLNTPSDEVSGEPDTKLPSYRNVDARLKHPHAALQWQY